MLDTDWLSGCDHVLTIVILPSHSLLASLESFGRFGFSKKAVASGVSNFVL